MKKAIIIILGIILLWNHLPYHYNNDKAVAYALNHHLQKSRSMCAWYVIKAMWRGGCPIGLVPAYAYEKTLPQMGFREISRQNYSPQKGDISVLPQNRKSHFGHIAIYDGRQWVSDFKQRSIMPGSAYRQKGEYRIFRISDGWHWKHVWTSPVDWYYWVESLVKGFHKIKF